MFSAFRKCTFGTLNYRAPNSTCRISRNQSQYSARFVRARSLHTSETPPNDEHAKSDAAPNPDLRQRTFAERVMIKYDSAGKEMGLKHTFVLASVIAAGLVWYECDEVAKERNHELGSLHVLFLLRLVLADVPGKVAEDKRTTLDLIQLFHDIFKEERDYLGKRVEKAANPQMEHMINLIKEKFKNAEDTKYVISLEDAQMMSEEETRKLKKFERAKVMVLKQSKHMLDVANGFKKGEASNIMHTLEESFVGELLPRLLEVLSKDDA